MSEASEHKKFTGLILLLFIAGGIFLCRGFITGWWLSRSFSQADLRQYEELFSWGDSGANSRPARTGKVVVVRPSVWQVYREGNLFLTDIDPAVEGKKERQIDPPRLDDAYFDLDSSIRASTPGEVETVILCTSASTKEGHYVYADSENRGIAGYAHRRQAVLKVYDFKNRCFLGEVVVFGEAPPEVTTSVGSHTGGAPDVAAYIRGMPVE